MQGGAQGRGQMYYQQPMPGQNMGPRRFPQQGGQQFQQGAPQGYMVNGPQGNRQPRQNQRRQGPGGPQQGKAGRGRGQGGPQPGRQPGPQYQQGLATCLLHQLHLLQALSTSLHSSPLCLPISRR